MPHSTLAGDANLLVLPNIDAANISYNLLKTAAGGNIAIGPVLLGAAKPVHILTASTTARRIVNMTGTTWRGRQRGPISGARTAGTNFPATAWLPVPASCPKFGQRLAFWKHMGHTTALSFRVYPGYSRNPARKAGRRPLKISWRRSVHGPLRGIKSACSPAA